MSHNSKLELSSIQSLGLIQLLLITRINSLQINHKNKYQFGNQFTTIAIVRKITSMYP